MAKKKSNLLANRDIGFLQNLSFRLKLIWRLMKDDRVNLFLKLLPVGALIYLISPIDLLPGIAFPVIGALDDAAVLWLGATLFVSLCPDNVVQEHTDALQQVVKGEWRDVTGQEGENKAIEVNASEDRKDEP
jgi:uncharacterized membrane protein YkvA (DUF1232 family)